MKNLTKRTKIALTVLCYLGFTLFFYSCKDDDAPPNCGCDSVTKITIPESANLTGKLFFKNDSNGNNYNNQKYWIVYIEENCVNCVHNLIICNDDFLNSISNIPTLSSINDIIGSVNELDGAIDVKFSGDLKIICNPIFAPADYSYDNITLTSIEQQ
jgi:hypothetical protein